MRKSHIITIVAAVIFCGCSTAENQTAEFRYTNPVLHLDYSDPDVCRVGNDYWMTASSFNCMPGLPILHSRDLVHWQLVGAALEDYEGAHMPVQHGKAVWAPAIRYHDGWYYIYVGDPDRGIFMVRTQNPMGRWEKPVWLVREKGFIDPCPLWDDDGRAWLSHGEAGSRAGLKSVLFVAPMSADGTTLLGPSRIVYDGHSTQPTIEGTKFYKKDGYYYIFSPAGGVATGWQTVLRSTSPYGPFEEKIVMAWAPGTINGPHQGAWVDTPSGENWFLHFQDKGAYGRIVHLQPMQWNADGWPLIGEDPDGDSVGQPVRSWSYPKEISPLASLGRNDKKTAPASVISSGAEGGVEKSLPGPYGLSLDWQYAAVPSPYWHMALQGEDIRLYSVEQKWPWRSLWDTPNTLLQKFPAERFTVTARMVFKPNPQLKEKGENAGFAVMGNDYAALKLTDTADGAVLEYVVCEGASEGAQEKAHRLAVLPYEMVPLPHEYESKNVPLVPYPDMPQAELWVKLEVRPRAVEGNVPDAVCRFYWSTDGKQYNKIVSPFTAKPELWIGAKFGFWCNRFAPKNDSGCVDVTNLEVKPEFAPLEGFNYDEDAASDYALPRVLKFQNQKPIGSLKAWEKRRSELLGILESEMYGTSPGRPAEESFNLLSEERNALDGLATRKEVRVNLGGGEYLTLLSYIPNAVKNAPVFLGVNFFGNHTVSDDPGISLPDISRWRSNFVLEPRGSQSQRWPLKAILEMGYAISTFCCEDVAPDSDSDNSKRVKSLYKEFTWGNIAAWAWGLSRALDYLETDPDVDASKVAVFGHSRMGKAALWAAASDRRFAMLVSNASGCGGAAVSRRRYGETVRRITTHYPYWFAPGFAKYGDNESALPFDQHEVLALVAPRPVYVASGSMDRWSDPRGEFIGLAETAPVYALYGVESIGSGEEPGFFRDSAALRALAEQRDYVPAGTPVTASALARSSGSWPAPGIIAAVSKGPTAYHIRRGRHEILLPDWQQYLLFADSQFRR